MKTVYFEVICQSCLISFSSYMVCNFGSRELQASKENSLTEHTYTNIKKQAFQLKVLCFTTHTNKLFYITHQKAELSICSQFPYTQTTQYKLFYITHQKLEFSSCSQPCSNDLTIEPSQRYILVW